MKHPSQPGEDTSRTWRTEVTNEHGRWSWNVVDDAGLTVRFPITTAFGLAIAKWPQRAEYLRGRNHSSRWGATLAAKWHARRARNAFAALREYRALDFIPDQVSRSYG